jgi:integrase
MEKARAMLIEALRRCNASADYTDKVLSDLGLDMPREANEKRRPKARTVSSMEEVLAAKPGVYRVDGNGATRLYLKKASTTKGSWFVRWRIRKGEEGAGRRLAIGLGSITDVDKLDTAIRLAKIIDAGLETGTNPRDVRAAYAAEVAAKAEAAKAEAALPTVAEMAERYVQARLNDTKKPWRGLRAAPDFINPLTTHIFPTIGGLKINEVTPKLVAKAFAGMEDKGLATHAVRTKLKTLFDWLLRRGDRDEKLGNPVAVIETGKASDKHYARVDEGRPLSTLPKLASTAFNKLLAAAPGNTTISAWVFMIMTAARPSEALTARWSDIDREAKLWRNPVSKTSKMLEVPLTATALAILDDMEKRRIAGVDLIFAGSTGGKLAHSNFGGAPKKAGIDAATAHSWRSVCADGLSEHCHIAQEVREMVLGHTLPKTEGAYRRGDAFQARLIAMARYEQWLLTGKDQDGSVIELVRAA